ncbi:N-carbamoyl-L-amino-acid hydrolase [Flavobacteriaceae bacterium MAR_2010_188]|nr:N-carbamoyl-L-amino-acid hydrolase [Flavobacteriaceae bacterium MAR_2010_188]
MYAAKLLFLSTLIFLLAFPAFAQGNKKESALRVNQDRIENRIFELAKFGQDSLGRNYRVAYSKGDVEGRKWFLQQMKDAGLEVSVDYAGNLIGKRAGKNPSLKTIAFGSHIDMVPDGGNYDGAVGSISGLEVMQTLIENNIVTKHPLELFIFSDEEGSLIGSKAISGHFNQDRMEVKSNSGLTIRDGLKAIGGLADSLDSVTRGKDDFLAFLELHIEQGGNLDRENIQIGVVEGIVGIEHWEVTIEGFANHAGTTPMNLRKDAMLSAAKLIVAVNEIITSHEGKQVGTVGKISAQPGAYNVIPGKVVLGLEIRDLSSETIKQMFSKIEEKAKEIAKEDGTTISFEDQLLGVIPALASPGIQNKIEAATKQLGYSFKYLPSGAGHDAQDMAMIAPMGMIFVPSKGGISHSPNEFTEAEDMANGANVLLQTILLLDKD